MRSYDVTVTRPLRAVWDAPPASPPPAKLVWRDTALVILIPLLIGIEAFTRAELPWLVLTTIVLIALVPLLLVRRTRPLLAFLVAFAAMSIVTIIVGDESILFTTVFVGLFPYALVRWGSGQAVLIGLTVMLVSFVVNELMPPVVLEDAIGGGVVMLIIVSLALAFRFRSSARLREVEQARLLERERLARDLHDSVAHHVSAITVTAQAGLATADSNPRAAVDALAVIEREATLTLADMRSMVHVLRLDDLAVETTSPKVTDIGQLVRGHDGGPRVDVEVRGDVDTLPSAVAVAVSRLVQESVTNARRHARNATTITVLIVRDDVGVHLKIVDDGEHPEPTTPGFGVTGMIERAALLGGSCTAGPASDRGWKVVATLPQEGWPP